MSFISRFGQKLTETPEQLHAQETRAWCGEIAEVQQITECRARTRRRVAGVVQSIKVVPRINTSTLEVLIYDGTDQLVGIWYGRRRIPGIDLGRRVILEGTISTFNSDTLQIINPAYELIGA